MQALYITASGASVQISSACPCMLTEAAKAPDLPPFAVAKLLTAVSADVTGQTQIT